MMQRPLPPREVVRSVVNYSGTSVKETWKPRIKYKIQSTKTSLSYSANTFITSEERNLTCPKSYVIQTFHCSPVPWDETGFAVQCLRE